MNWLSDIDINRYIEHTLLKNCQEFHIERLCEEGLKLGFFGVCVQPDYIKTAKDIIRESNLKVVSVIDFPFGINKTSVKQKITEFAIKDGVDELDMVMNINQFLNENYIEVQKDIELVKEICNENVLKVIIQTPLLTEEQIIIATRIVINAGGDFVKTSTGLITNPTTVHEVEVIEKNSDGKISIKASGGIRSYKNAIEMIKAGAVRIGTSSGVTISEEERYHKNS
jgi:deoxyribose-phosphate aldolase